MFIDTLSTSQMHKWHFRFHMNLFNCRLVSKCFNVMWTVGSMVNLNNYLNYGCKEQVFSQLSFASFIKHQNVTVFLKIFSLQWKSLGCSLLNVTWGFIRDYWKFHRFHLCVFPPKCQFIVGAADITFILRYSDNMFNVYLPLQDLLLFIISGQTYKVCPVDDVPLLMREDSQLRDTLLHFHTLRSTVISLIKYDRVYWLLNSLQKTFKRSERLNLKVDGQVPRVCVCEKLSVQPYVFDLEQCSQIKATKVQTHQSGSLTSSCRGSGWRWGFLCWKIKQLLKSLQSLYYK